MDEKVSSCVKFCNSREEAEQHLYYAMMIGEELLISGAEVGRVEDTIRRICISYGAERVDVFLSRPASSQPCMESLAFVHRRDVSGEWQMILGSWTT